MFFYKNHLTHRYLTSFTFHFQLVLNEQANISIVALALCSFSDQNQIRISSESESVSFSIYSKTKACNIKHDLNSVHSGLPSPLFANFFDIFSDWVKFMNKYFCITGTGI